MAMSSIHSRSMQKKLYIAAVIAAAFAVVIIFFPTSPAPAGAHPGLSPVRTLDAAPVPVLYSDGDELPARGKFLVASGAIADQRFRETVILLLSYDVNGASGLIINRPTKVPLSEVLPNVPGLMTRPDVAYYGGPVQGHRMHVLIRSPEKPAQSENVFLNVYFSLSRQTFESMIEAHKPPKQIRVYAGYAGWLPGQLDREVSRGDWYIIDADADSIFETEASGIWIELIRRSSAIEVWKHYSDERLTS
jgi:putative transcriptional regulator